MTRAPRMSGASTHFANQTKDRVKRRTVSFDIRLSPRPQNREARHVQGSARSHRHHREKSNFPMRPLMPINHHSMSGSGHENTTCHRTSCLADDVENGPPFLSANVHTFGSEADEWRPARAPLTRIGRIFFPRLTSMNYNSPDFERLPVRPGSACGS